MPYGLRSAPQRQLSDLEQIMADLDAAGLSVPEAAPEPTPFDPGRLGGFLEAFSGLEGLPQAAPNNFAQGLVGGLQRGLGTAGSRIAQRRQEFDESQAKRRAAVDAERLQAMKDRRNLAFTTLNETRKEDRDARRKAAEEAAKNPPIGSAEYRTQRQRRQDEAADAAIGRARAPESAAERRAAAAAERAVAANERANRSAIANIEGKIADDYKADPAIKGYQGVRSNLITAETAAKQNSGPGDIALVFSFMRALEPENPNAVREGEFDNARKAAGKLQQFKNLPGRFFKGNQLTQEGREYFLNTMRAQLASRESDFKSANEQYQERITAGGGEPSRIIRQYPSVGTARSRTPYLPPPGGFFDRNRPGGK